MPPTLRTDGRVKGTVKGTVPDGLESDNPLVLDGRCEQLDTYKTWAARFHQTISKDTMEKQPIFQRKQSQSDETSLWQSLGKLLLSVVAVAVTVVETSVGNPSTSTKICLVACHCLASFPV